MVSLKFLHLPGIPQRLIIQNFDPIDILLFSLLSKNCHSLAEFVKTSVESLTCRSTCLDMNEEAEATKIHFVENWQIRGFKPRARSRLTTELDGVLVTFWLTAVSRYLLVAYDAEKTREVTEGPYEAVLNRLLGMLKLKKIEDKTYNWSFGLAPKSLFTKINVDCETLQIQGTFIESEDLEAILNKWQEGGFPRLKEMHVQPWWYANSQLSLKMGPENEKRQQVLTDNKGNIGILQIGPSKNTLEFRVNPTN